MNLIKRHKGLAIVGGLTLILIIVIFIICARMIFSTGESEYGQRLNDLVKIDNNVTQGIVEELQENENVEEVTIRTQGKIIYTTIIFKEGTNINKAKELANNTLSKYDEEVISCYDFGYFLKENVEVSEDAEDEEQKQGFTVAGTKHPDTEGISWTKK